MDRDRRPDPVDPPSVDVESGSNQLTRRGFFKGAGIGVAGVAAAASPLGIFAGDARAAAIPDGTPEQIHLTWGNDPTSEVFVSWASAAQAVNALVKFGLSPDHLHTVHAIQRTYTDGLNGQTIFTYHAKLSGLKPASTVHYVVTADNDGNVDEPFSSTFQTAPRGRASFRWTSYGDLATPVTSWVLSSPQSRNAVAAVERGYSHGAQTRWLEKTLSEAAENRSIDWIIVQMHQDALSSSKTGNGSDKGIREIWLPLFDRYGVDLVLCGHDHDYERSWPVRGCNHNVGTDAATGEVVDTLQPKPVVIADAAPNHFDTSRGTIHLILGGGGTSAPLDVYGLDPSNGLTQAKVITKPNRPVPGSTAGAFVRSGADALEDAIWSAQRDTGTGYGIAVFDLDPGGPRGHTSITVRYYHAPGADQVPTPNYELFETIVLSKRRRDDND
jgi:hypothetical protein